MDEILELANQVENAMDWLRSALNTAGNFCVVDTGKCDDIGAPIMQDSGWQEMHEVYRRLDEARKFLDTALEPVKDVIDEEQKRYDEGPDECDPHGFKYHPMA